MSAPIAKCRYMIAAYPTLDVDDTCGKYGDHRHDEQTFALARAFAVAFQDPEPSDEQIAWFLADAAAIVDDFAPPPTEWSFEERQVTEGESFNLDHAFSLNGVEYVVQQSEWEPSRPVKRTTWESWIADAEAAAQMTASTDLDDTLANIRARVEAATEGPWFVEPCGDFGAKTALIPDVLRERYGVNSLSCGEDFATAEFIAHARTDVPRLLDLLAEQRAVIARARALHKPIRVYDECDHQDCENDPIEVYDYAACRDSQIGWGCLVCCYDDEHPREHCPHGGDHRDVVEADSCPTHSALDGADTTTTDGSEA